MNERDLHRDVVRTFQDFAEVLKGELCGRVPEEKVGAIDGILHDCARRVLEVLDAEGLKAHVRRVVKVGSKKRGFSWYVSIPAKAREMFADGAVRVYVVEGVMIVVPERRGRGCSGGKN